MLHCLTLLIKAICCVAVADQNIKAAESTGICLPIKCCLAIKDCYDQCDATVTPVNHDVEMAGAPAAESMA